MKKLTKYKILNTVTLGRIGKFKHRYHKLKNLEFNQNNSTFDEKKNNLGVQNITFNFNKKLKVTIVVPNYNHSEYLEERLESIYGQSYKNFEVILLDDVSTDDSVSILKKFKKRYPDVTSLYINTANSGSPYKQWKKGINLAKGDLIWIAESDDFCELNFLENHVSSFFDDSIMLSFSSSKFIKNGEICDSSAQNLADFVCPDVWNHSFVISSHDFVNNFLGIKNVIINVSSCVFKNINISLLDESNWENFKLCGDWIFYLNLIQGGRVVFNSNTTNYYRIHERSTSLSVQKELEYYKEHEKVACEIVKLYKISWRTIEKNYSILQDRFSIQYSDRYNFEDFYNLKEVISCLKYRKPNILMCCFSLTSGGGETFPINLANALKRKGYPVTLFDFCGQERNVNILGRILSNLPVISRNDLDIFEIIRQFGIDVVHSHHMSCDVEFSKLKEFFPRLTHLVTMHGMYELVDSNNLPFCLDNVDKWVYIAEKNLTSFINSSFSDNKRFYKIFNAVPYSEYRAVSRSELGISFDSFVFCIVSRGIPEKGWQEAIDALDLCRRITGQDVHLIIVGDGPEYDRLIHIVPNFVHMVGFRNNVLDFLASGNVTLVSSRFAGESVPLVILESFIVGNPVLSSNLGEVSNMIVRNGIEAGLTFNLTSSNSIPMNELVDCMCKFVSDKSYYYLLKSNVDYVGKQFNFDHMLDQYISLYGDPTK